MTTTAYTLSTTWQEITLAEGAHIIAFEIDGVARFALGGSQPTGTNYVEATGGFLSGQFGGPLWVSLEDADDTGEVKVIELTGTYSLGSGLGALVIAPSLNISAKAIELDL